VTLPLIAALARLSADGRRVVAELMEVAEPSDDLVAEVIRLVEGAVGWRRRASARWISRSRPRRSSMFSSLAGARRAAGSIAYAVERRS